jgi:uncharacterized protein
MSPVTYSLGLGTGNSEPYYAHIREFADEVLEHASGVLSQVVTEFREYVRTYRLEELRSTEEYYLELLSFGLLWNSYGGYALAARVAPFVTMARMAEWRKRHAQWKPAIDLARGLITTLMLMPASGRKKPAPDPTLRDVDRLCRWLEATGEFREQALRFVRWRAFWETMDAHQRACMASALFGFADWFTARSEEALGMYTTKVGKFLEGASRRYRWREDRIQCSRPRAEYHLNMVGAELMNRAFKKDFLNTERTALLLPGCMRAKVEGECKGERVREGVRCTGCTPACRVNTLREMGTRDNFEVYIIPHASDLRHWSPRPGQPRRGVVASACVTTLVEGGWELKRYDVPAQCVLLDYSGCQKHWHATGVPTRMNMRELKRVLPECK